MASNDAAGFPESPYVGLDPYTERTARYFFGREADRRIIVANLRSRRLTLLYGESGVGKSSLLNAGVAWELKGLAREALAKAARTNMLVTVFSSWRDDPVAGLADAVYASLRDLSGERAGEPVPRSQPLVETLREYGERLGGTLLIVLDQFEEYFVYHPAEDGAGTFALEFPRALGDERLRARFLLSIREDALAKLDRFKGRVPNLFDSYLRVNHLDRASARAAIEKPIERFNEDVRCEPVSIQPELVEAVLDQVAAGEVELEQGGRGGLAMGSAPAKEAIETPYLQLVLTRLWEKERQQGSRILRLATLEVLGGAETIARTHLDRALEELSTEEQDAAGDAFRYLVTPAGTKIAHTIPTLAEWTGHPEAELEPVLERLTDPRVRILRPVAGPVDEPGTVSYEIFHDVLGPAVLDWRRRHAQARLEREKEEAESRAGAEQRRARIFRGLTIVFFVVAAAATAVAVAAAIWAFHQRDKAVGQRNVAHASQLAAQALALLPDDPRLGLALAVSSIDVHPTPAGLQAVRFALSASPARGFLLGHTNWINTVRWSPNGRYLVTASDDRSVRIWNSRSSRLVTILRGHTGFVNMANWSADGRRVVTAGDSTARIWDWQSANDAKPLILRVGPPSKDCSASGTCVNVADFGGPQSQYVLTASFDNFVRIWDSHTGKLLWKRKVLGVRTAAIDTSGKFVLAAAFLEGSIYDWQDPAAKSVAINAPGANGEHAQADAINDVAFSSDGRYVITGSEDRSVVVWDARKGGRLAQLFGPRKGVTSVSMSPNGRLVAAGSRDGALYFFVWRSENRIAKIVGHADVVSDVAFSPDGHTLASAGGDRTARLWAVPPVQILVHHQPVNWAAWSPNGKYAVTATSECLSQPVFTCKAFVWDVSDPNVEPKLVKVLAKHTDWVTGAGFSPDSSKLVTGGDDAVARVWSVPEGRELKVLKGDSDWLNSASFSPDGHLVITSSLDGTVRIWDWRQAKTISTIKGSVEIGSASFDPSGRYVLTTAASPHDYSVKVWDWRRNVAKPFRTLVGHRGLVNYASWSPDGRYVVSASSDGTARVWDWRRGIALADLRGQPGALRDAAFSLNGRYVVTTSSDGSTRIWEWRSETALTQVTWHVDLVHSGEFSPDGRRILTSSDDWSAAIFHCETCGPFDQVLAVARARVARTVTPAELAAALR